MIFNNEQVKKILKELLKRYVDDGLKTKSRFLYDILIVEILNFLNKSNIQIYKNNTLISENYEILNTVLYNYRTNNKFNPIKVINFLKKVDLLEDFLDIIKLPKTFKISNGCCDKSYEITNFEKINHNKINTDIKISKGCKYIAISYSSNPYSIIQQETIKPCILIYKICDLGWENKICYKIELEDIYSIGSIQIVDDNKCPYVLIGSKSQPLEQNCQLLKWKFKKDDLSCIIKFTNANSINNIVRYTNCDLDKILFTTFNDNIYCRYTTKLYGLNVKNLCYKNLDTYKFKYNSKKIKGSIWEIKLVDNLLFLSISKTKKSEDNYSGFITLGRLYFVEIDNLFNCDRYKIDVKCLIGNCNYPLGFGINSISFFQVEHYKDKIYISTISDTYYQILNFNINLFQSYDINILSLRDIVCKLNIDGFRVFCVDKNDLYKENLIITTLVGHPVENTLNKSKTKNGHNNFLNIGCKCSISSNHNIYYGIRNIARIFYQFIVNFITDDDNVKEFLLSLPEEIILLIINIIFNKDFTLPMDIDNTTLNSKILCLNHNDSKLIDSEEFNNCIGITDIKKVIIDNKGYLLVGISSNVENNTKILKILIN